jgi:hypothetical protein
MTGPLITGQHITYVIWGFTALSVWWRMRQRRQPHAAVCRCDRCRKQGKADDDQ